VIVGQHLMLYARVMHRSQRQEKREVSEEADSFFSLYARVMHKPFVKQVWHVCRDCITPWQ
jgi:hypothetical protein